MYIVYLHAKLHIEKWLWSRSLEVENFRMLKPIRKQRPNGILRLFQLFFKRLGHSLIAMGERLEGREISSIS
jgi:hypothetical protein